MCYNYDEKDRKFEHCKRKDHNYNKTVMNLYPKGLKEKPILIFIYVHVYVHSLILGTDRQTDNMITVTLHSVQS